MILQLWRTLASEGSGGSGGRDARKNARLPTRQRVAIDIDGALFEAELIDVSHAGVQVRTKDKRAAALTSGTAALWRSAQTANAAYALDLPCVLSWVRAVDDATAIGFSFDDADRARWGEAFFTWYARVYREHLWSLVRG